MWVIYNRHSRSWLGRAMIPTTVSSEAIKYGTEQSAQQRLQFLNGHWIESACVFKEIKVKGYVCIDARSGNYYQFDRSILRHDDLGRSSTVFSTPRELESTSRHNQLITESLEVTV